MNSGESATRRKEMMRLRKKKERRLGAGTPIKRISPACSLELFEKYFVTRDGDRFQGLIC